MNLYSLLLLESGGQVNEPVKLGADAVGYVFDESTATGLPPVGPIWGR